MARHLPTVLVLLLLAATAAAFVVAEDLKLQPDPIATPRIDPAVSPICRCERQNARISFRLRNADRLTLAILDEQGRIVRTILREARFPRGRHEFGWDGRDDRGRIAPEGQYRPRVQLAALGRAIEFPREIAVDMTPAKIALTLISRRVISPDGDGRGDGLLVRYRVDEPAQALLLVDGRQRAKTRLGGSGALAWTPRRYRPGRYTLTLSALDAAGNRSRATARVPLLVRYVAVMPERVRVRPRRQFSVRISADAERYSWRLGRRRGVARSRVLRLRAPARPGRYALTASVSGRRDSAVVVVRRG